MASPYRDRPWLRLYQQGKPAEISPEHSDALSMWRSGLARFGTVHSCTTSTLR